MSAHSGTLQELTVTTPSGPREYLLFVPSSVESTTPAPVILDFHGFNSSATHEFEQSGFVPVAESLGTIMVYPKGTEVNGAAHWNVGGFTAGSTANDVEFVDVLLDTLMAQYNIDSSRVYATGFSNGGFMALRLACELSHRIAAVASVAGGIAPEIAAECAPQRPIAMMQIHGSDDEVIAYSGTPWSLPIEDVVQFWVNNNTCTAEPEMLSMPNEDELDSVQAIRIDYRDCDSAVSVAHIVVEGGGHFWPGERAATPGICNDFAASDVIAEFLLQYSLTAPTPTSIEPITRSEVPKRSVQLLPNPAQNHVVVHGGIAGETMQLVDLSGRVVHIIEVVSHQQSVSLVGLQSGVYRLVFSDYSAPLIIQH